MTENRELPANTDPRTPGRNASSRSIESRKSETRNRRRLRIGRIAGLVFAGSLVYLLLSSVLTPLFTNVSTRAVINAPVRLITSPIAGDVVHSSLRPGDRFAKDDAIAVVRNNRVDRATLLDHESQLLAIEERANTLDANLSLRKKEIAEVESDLEVQRGQLMAHLESLEKEAGAKLAAADAAVRERTTVVRRQEILLKQGHVTEQYVVPAREQLAFAVKERAAAASILDRTLAQRRAAESGTYSAQTSGALYALQQKRNEAQREFNRLEAERREVGARRDALRQMVGAEKDRLAKLSAANIVAPDGGTVIEVVSPGRSVAAGATLVRAADCAETFAVAIFPERSAEDLAVGTPAVVEVNGSETYQGAVKQIIAQGTDRVRELYAVPFVPTERRELYVVVEIKGPRAPKAARADQRAQACQVGQWARVRVGEPWFARVENAIGRIGSGALAAIGSVWN